MCGLVVFARLSGALAAEDEAIAARMGSQLAHRGPDEASVARFDDWAVLAHRRLSIIDVAGSPQPLSNEDGSIVTVFNGEIYNFQELRQRLAALGHVFRTHGDGEVIIHAFEEWGAAAVERLEGMFAFALLDRRRNTLVLARDRFGIKPLFYGVHGGVFRAASELKAILADPRVPRRADGLALAIGGARTHVPWPLTAFDGLRRLEPGAILELARGEAAPTRRRFAPLVERPRPTLRGADAVDAVEAALTRAVRRQMVADVPVGAFLSGGVDSSLVTALMCRLSAAPVHTFSIKVRGAHDESSVAERTARTLGTVHKTIELDQFDVADVLQLPESFDEPFAEVSALGVRALSIAARADVKVALSGDGGDEIFGGYDGHRWVSQLDRVRRPFPAVVPAVVGRVARASLRRGRWPSPLRRTLRMLSVADLSCGDAYRAVAGLDWADQNESAAASRALTARIEGLVAGALDGATPERLAMFTDRIERLPNAMLTKVDVASMSASLEVRVPLLDDELVRLAASLAPDAMIGLGRGKIVLRRILDRHGLGELAWASKRGFSLPLEAWMSRPAAAIELGTFLGDHDARIGALTGTSPLALWKDFVGNRTRLSRGSAALRLLWFMTVGSWASRFGVTEVAYTRLEDVDIV